MNFKNVFKKVLSFSTLVVSKIPTREDTKYSSAIKIASLVDFMVDEFYENNIPLQRFIQNLGNDIIKSKDKEFEKFLFKNGFDKLFDLKSHRLTDSNIGIPIDIIELKNKQYGNLYFISYSSWCDKQEFDFFFYSKGFDFKSIFDLLWKDLNNNIHISCIYESLLDSKNIEYSEIKKDNGFVFNKKTQEKIDKFVGLYLNYKKDFVSRKYLFYGLPGTGKTSFAMEVANKFGNKVLRVDTGILNKTNLSFFDSVVNNLSPDFIIIDDIDHVANLKESMPGLLTMLTDFGLKYPSTTVIFTANNKSVLDSAFIRPGRIDELVEFAAPDVEERKEILCGYFEKMNVDKNDALINELAEITEGLTAAYLKEVVVQIKYKPTEEAIEIIKNMKVS